jgi:hypothetical protein
MRRILLPILLIVSLLSPFATVNSASAAPKKAVPKQVSVKKLDLLTSVKDAEGLLAIGKTLITYSNTAGSNSNILITSLDATGVQLWQKTIDSGVDEVALAATTDTSGNLWIAGACAPVVAVDTRTVQIPTDNPDGVVVEQSSPLRGDLNLLTLWKISSQGELVATYSAAESAPALISGISANASGVSIVGQLLDKPFLISASPLGVFGKLISIGSAKTQINSVVRNSDGSINVFGSSAETLGGKKLIGIRDGFLIKVSKTGTLTTVVRSSAPKGDRSWINSDNSLALTGYVKTGKIVESAFTKFTSAFAPTWTIRFPSDGSSAVLSAAGATYAAIGSNSAVSGVSGWKPSTSQLLLLALDSKGVITAAYSAPELSDPISLTYSKELGLYGLAKASDGTLMVFRLALP